MHVPGEKISDQPRVRAWPRPPQAPPLRQSQGTAPANRARDRRPPGPRAGLPSERRDTLGRQATLARASTALATWRSGDLKF